MTQQRILITGGSGFIGTNAVEVALAAGHEVLNIDVAPPRNPEQRSCWSKVDILNKQGLKDAVSQFNPTQAVHLAARTDLGETKNLSGYAANIEGTENVMNALIACPKVRHAVIASTQLVCRVGDSPASDTSFCPNTLYGQSKVETEKIVRKNGRDAPFGWTILRPVSIWGPWFGKPYKDFFLTVNRGYYFHPGTQSVLRSTGYVGNTIHHINSILSAPRAQVNGKVFYTGFYQPVDIRDWANIIAQELNVHRIRSVALPIWKVAAAIGDVLKALGWQHVPISSFRLRNMLTETNYDTDLSDLCGPEPYSLEQSVRETVRWLRKSGEI